MLPLHSIKGHTLRTRIETVASLFTSLYTSTKSAVIPFASEEEVFMVFVCAFVEAVLCCSAGMHLC